MDLNHLLLVSLGSVLIPTPVFQPPPPILCSVLTLGRNPPSHFQFTSMYHLSILVSRRSEAPCIEERGREGRRKERREERRRQEMSATLSTLLRKRHINSQSQLFINRKQ